MADIAFLLLVFFLVATTIMEDEGLSVRLPPLDAVSKTPDKKIINVKVNGEGALLIEKEISEISMLTPRIKTFLNTYKDKSVVSFQCDEETNYQDYLAIYEQLKFAYYEVWDEIALEEYNKSFQRISKEEQKQIIKKMPLKISEADPFSN